MLDRGIPFCTMDDLTIYKVSFCSYVSDSGRKVEDPDMLEMIRLTIIDNLLKYHPVKFHPGSAHTFVSFMWVLRIVGLVVSHFCVSWA